MTAQSIGASMAALLLGGVLAAPVSAAEVAASVNIGSLGPGASVIIAINDQFTARLGLTSWDYDTDLDADGISYSINLELDTKYALLDWYPRGGNFRVSGGLMSNGNAITGTASASGTVDIGGSSYDLSQIGTLSTKMDFDSSAPYLGVGWDWARPARGERGFSVALDLGVLFQGSPKVSLSQQGGVVTIAQSDLDAEERNIQDDVTGFDYYPVVAVAAVYHF